MRDLNKEKAKLHSVQNKAIGKKQRKIVAGSSRKRTQPARK